MLLDQESRDEELAQMLEDAEDPWIEGLDDGTPYKAVAPGFTVGNILACGEQGVIFEATADANKEPAVVKVARSPSARCRWRLEQEARILERLSHKGIPRLIADGWAETNRGRRYFLAVQYVPGTVVTEYFRNRAADYASKLGLFIKVCEAVNVAHARGVVHRDLKPANILVRDNGQPVVLDFGVAKDLAGPVAGGSRQTALGQLIGTLQYMAPEQVNGERAIDTRCDVFTLGLILFELLTWRRPRSLTRATLGEAVETIGREPAPPLSRYLQDAPPGLERVIARALTLDRERRYTTAGHLAKDLREIVETLEAPPGRRRRALRGGDRRGRWRRAVPRIAAAAGVGVGIALGFLLRSALSM